MAEEKTHAEEDEKHGLRRGTSLYCKLSIQEVQEALNFQAKKAAQKVYAGMNDEKAKMIKKNATAEIALKLATWMRHVCKKNGRA